MTIYDYREFLNKFMTIDSFIKSSLEEIELIESGDTTKIWHITEVKHETTEEAIEDIHSDIIFRTNLMATTKKQLVEVDKFIKLAENENLTISKSPYSDSFYAHQSSEIIDWGVKPENSYRLADHWNFDGHCPTETGECFGFAVAKNINGVYVQI